MNDLPSRSASGNDLLVKTKVLDMDSNIAAALSYVPLVGANIIFSILWFATEPKSNKYLRKHAVQSLVLNVGFVGLHLVLMMISFTLAIMPFLGFLSFIPSLVGVLVSLGYFLGNLYMMYCAYKGRQLEIPFVSAIAEQNS